MSKKEDKFYYKDGTTSDEWYHSKILHRTDGPAVAYTNGDKEWYVDGKLHRVDGPAIELANGDKEWYIDNKFHRLDGPAVEYADGTKYWYVDDEKYTKKQFNKLIKQVNEMSTSMKLTDPRWWVRELGENEVKLVG